MPKLIDTKGQLLDNGWQLQPRDATLEQVLESTAGQLLVNVALWLEAKDVLLASGKQFALWLDSDQPLTLLAETLPQVALVALNFPGFMDGRSYSKAVKLRCQYGFTGEIRAIGDVLRDQLFYMKRCGFSTFDLKDSVKLEEARRAFADFSTNYQSTVEEPLPLFRRRA
jgi:uncharacterized protein (DUF934 family)